MTDLRETLARAIAKGLGDDFDAVFVDKSEWAVARGVKGGRYRGVNEPLRVDYLAAADDVLAAVVSPLIAERDALRIAAHEALNVLIGCVAPMGGCDDRRHYEDVITALKQVLDRKP